jgi:WD40 repeat protein
MERFEKIPTFSCYCVAEPEISADLEISLVEQSIDSVSTELPTSTQKLEISSDSPSLMSPPLARKISTLVCFASGSVNGQIRVWDNRGSDPVSQHQHHKGPVHAIHANQSVVASCGEVQLPAFIYLFIFFYFEF